jgi:hypothetical protein
MLSPYADGCLSRMRESTGKTRRDIVKQALIELENRIV